MGEPRAQPKFNRDPTEEMLKAGWIRHGSSRGQWIYGPEATHIFRTFEQIVLDEIIKALRIPRDDLSKARHLGRLEEERPCPGCLSGDLLRLSSQNKGSCLLGRGNGLLQGHP